jgi:hypothetical protein
VLYAPGLALTSGASSFSTLYSLLSAPITFAHPPVTLHRAPASYTHP